MPKAVAPKKGRSPKKGKKSNSSTQKEGGGGHTQQLKLIGAGAPTLVDQDVLFTEVIYEDKVPKGMEGMLFHYTVSNYDHKKKLFEVTYKKKYISKEGVSWISDDAASDSDKLFGFTLEAIDNGIKLYNAQYSKIKTFELEKKKVAETLLKEKEGKDDEEYDFTVLDQTAMRDPKGWMGESIIEAVFELTGETGLAS